MVVVKIELWPKGDESKAKEIGRMCLANTGKGNIHYADYKVELGHIERFADQPGNWRTGIVENFFRELSPYHLVARALKACGIA